MGSPAFGDILFEDRLGRADVEDADFRAKMGVEKRVYLELSGCSWISRHHNLIITGPMGVKKSYLAWA